MSSKTQQPGQTLDQRRASHAWDVIRDILTQYPPTIVKENGKEKKVPHEQAKKFGGQAKKLPTRIMAAGLGQALAFLKAKAYAPGLLAALTEWMTERIPPRQGEPGDLVERIVKGDSDFLRRASGEVLAYLVWLNRFAEAEGLTEEREG
ncbi:MAG: type III-B CRISPR module-associated protein Cmr5 [Thermoguttaceae bacterium]|jgi:CRISPR-associated protein Cmr5|nr:type III-B CRISPR module-associated protein Cmr5 [Thermoguttaceae bacterium]